MIKATSEALLYAAASCFNKIHIYKSLSEQYFDKACTGNTKLMFTIFNGGKSIGSTVKFSKFYLIIDAKNAIENGYSQDLGECFGKF